NIGIVDAFGHCPPHRAVQKPGVEMGQAVMGGERRPDRALARGGRAIDGDNHAASPSGEKPAPSREKSSMNEGKLVAIMRSSSTVTGLSDAMPMTRKLMAMRWSRWVSTVPPPGTWPLPST